MSTVITVRSARLDRARPLHFPSEDAALDLPAHARAGSGLRRWAGRLVIVQDDVNAIALLDERTGALTAVALPEGPEGRRHFSDARGNKAHKLDLEACVVLPDGRLLALGSGSTPARERLALVTPGGSARLVDGGPLYADLRARVDFSGAELNVEGAAVVGESLWLFQRGNGANRDGLTAQSAIGALPMAELLLWLDGVGPVPRLDSARVVDLGSVRGVPWGFTDAAALPDGRVVFLAGAEASPDTYRDGEVLGARVGLLDGDWVVMAEILDDAGRTTSLKLEGVDFLGFTETGALELAVVADLDDPEVPAVVARLVWDLRGAGAPGPSR